MKQIEITKYLNKEYPEELASHFDSGKISLQFGSNNKEIKKVMIALDGTTDVVNQAIDSNCDLLICHHPFMFSPLLSLNFWISNDLINLLFKCVYIVPEPGEKIG